MVFRGSKYLKGGSRTSSGTEGGNEKAAEEPVGPERTFDEELGDEGVSLPLHQPAVGF